MQKPTYIADPEILLIPIQECGEPLIDIKSQTILQYGPPPECELTANCYTHIRATVYKKICDAQSDLPHHWRFRLYEGYRSLQVQGMLFEEEFKRVQVRHPHLNSAEIFHEATRLVSPVKHFDGSSNMPPHNTGGAIDIEIVTAEGELVDMGMAAKDWCHVNPELCVTACDFISDEVKQNRRILMDVMQAHGFVNYPMEWWHFSYGDRYWAYCTGKSEAIYGSIEALVV